VTLLGCIYGCHTFVDWLKLNPRSAHLINTASFAAMASAPGMGAYNVAKAGVLSLSETLYAELLPQHVGVTVVCPVFFKTNLVATGRFDSPAHAAAAETLMRQSRFTAEDVADATVRAMHRKQLYVVLDGKARWLWRFKRLAPTRFLKAVANMYKKRTRG
jgi:short-subunit dehydrogenase